MNRILRALNLREPETPDSDSNSPGIEVVNAFIQHSTDIIAVLSAEGEVQFASPSLQRVLGFDPGDVHGTLVFDYIHPEDQARVRQALANIFDNPGNAQRVEFRFRHQRGVWRELEAVGQTYQDPQREAVCVINARDVSDRVQTDAQLVQQLKESQALFRISQMLAGSLDMSLVLQQIVEAASSLITRADCAVLHLLEADDTRLQAVAVAGPDREAVNRTQNTNMKPGRGVAGMVIESGETLHLDDAPRDPRYISTGTDSGRIRSLLVAPVRTGTKSLGTLSVYCNRPSAFTDDDARLLTTFGVQAAVALEKAQLLDTEREQRQLAEALHEIGLALSSSLEFGIVLDRLLDQIGRVVPYDSAAILLVEDGRCLIVRASGLERHGESVRGSLAGGAQELESLPQLNWMVQHGEALIISDTEKAADWAPIDASPQARSWAGAPILAQGKVIAFFSLGKQEAGFYQPEHGERLSVFASQAALALQNARLFEATDRRLKEVNALYRISRRMAATLDLDEVLELVVALLQENFGYDHIHVYLIDPPKGELMLVHGSGPSGVELSNRGHRLAAGEGIVGHVATTGKGFITNDVDETLFFVRTPLLPDTKSELAAPLLMGNKVLGVLDIQNRPPKTFTSGDLQLLEAVADQLAVTVQNALLYADLQEALRQEQSTRAQLVQTGKLTAMGRLTASVAHELNNPLQAIQNALYLVKLEAGLTEQAKEDLQVAIAEADRMADLIARLRETYRPTMDVEFHPHSLNDLVIEVQRLITTHMRHSEVKFDFEPDPTLPDVPLVRDQIKQVILNLCLNAIEAMSDGGRLSIRPDYQQDEDRVGLRISDTGSGIDPSILPNVFEPFFTTKDGGTGLGLAIIYDIIQRHQGEIRVESVPGEGSVFHFWLPRTRKHVPDEVLRTSMPAASAK